MKHVVFFDWDNTLISFGSFLVKILKQIADEMDIIPISPIVIPTKTKSDTLLSIFGHQWKDAEVLFNARYKELKPENFNALSGAAELLEKICHARIPIAIISNKKKEDILIELEQQMIVEFDETNTVINKKWASFIEVLAENFVILGSDCVIHPKPHCESGLEALKKFKIPYESKPVEILHIGDGGLESDVGFAKNLTNELQKFHPLSSCKSLLFNLYIDEYDKEVQEKQLHLEEELLEIPYDYISYGYGKVGCIVRNFINSDMEKITHQLNGHELQLKSNTANAVQIGQDIDETSTSISCNF